MTIEAVIFDIGNVLIDWNPEQLYDSVFGEERRKEVFAKVDLNGLNERVDLGEDYREVFYAAAEATPEYGDEIRMWHDRWIEMASPVIPRSVHLMEALQAKGIPVFSLSNFGIQSYEHAATFYPFFRKFDRDFISGHMGIIKPNDEIYAAVEDASGIAPERLIFTDDRANNIEAAAARGWKTHLFEGPQGWADRLVTEGLLTTDEAA